MANCLRFVEAKGNEHIVQIVSTTLCIRCWEIRGF